MSPIVSRTGGGFLSGVGFGAAKAKANLPTYSVSPSTTSLNEGSSVTFTVTTTNVVDGTTLYWTTAAVSGTINTSDFNDSAVSGSFTITNNTGSFSRTLANDATTEGSESFQIEIRTVSTSGSIVATSSTITIGDTSLTPTYSISESTTSLNEGSSVTFTVNTTNVSNGTTLYWSTSAISGTINTADFNDGTTTGSFTISGNTGSFSRTLANDVNTEGSESFVIYIRTGSTSGTIVATSSTITIGDTSLSIPTYSAGQSLSLATQSYGSGERTDVFMVDSSVVTMNIHIGGGAGGGGGGWNQCGASGGAGGRASGIWTVDANKTFRYYVGDGGVGGCAYSGAGAGGGASALVINGSLTPVIVAGAGGGGGDGWNGTAGTGGAGGTISGSGGQSIGNGSNGQTTQSAGGGGGSSVAGTNTSSSLANASGSTGGKGGDQGGTGGGGASTYGQGGARNTSYYWGGGGGGGGYRGGAGGWGSSAGDGGGGGSSFIASGMSALANAYGASSAGSGTCSYGGCGGSGQSGFLYITFSSSSAPPPGLFSFTSYTFLPIVSAGSPTGPTLAQMQSAYAGTSWISSYFTLGSYQGYQRWTVPSTGNYTIEAGGGMGGDGTAVYGTSISTKSYGAKIIGTFSLTQGHVLEMVIGSKGGSSGGPHGNENGGGGGTFIRNVTTNTLLLVAGGAGGVPSSSYGTSCSRTVSTGHGQSGTTPGNPSGCYTTVSTASGGVGGYSAGSYQGAAGGGYSGNGANGGTHCSTAIGGQGFNNGMVGGAGNSCYNSNNAGGFGGGGGGMLGAPGAGGGYNGGSVTGAWSSYSNYGGGGGSYNVGTSQTNTTGGNTGSEGGYVGAGYCKITKL